MFSSRPLIMAGVMALSVSGAWAQDTKAPEFKAKDANGKEHSLAGYKGKVVVLEFTNAGSPVTGKDGCPFMIPRYEQKIMQKLASKVEGMGGVYLAVNSNSYNTPADSLALAKQYDVKFPTLIDSDGAIGKSFGAKTTPHMFVIGKEGKVVYDGALNDNASPDVSKDASAKPYVELAVAAAVKGEKPAEAKTKPYGCGIKY